MFGLPKTPVTNQRAIERAQLRLFLFCGYREPGSLRQIPFTSVIDISGFRGLRVILIGTAVSSLSPIQAIGHIKPERYCGFSSGQFEAVLAEHIREEWS